MSTVDIVGARWRTSSFSGGGDEANCVQVARLSELAALRDSKNPDGQVLALGLPAWAAFLTRLS